MQVFVFYRNFLSKLKKCENFTSKYSNYGNVLSQNVKGNIVCSVR